MIRKTTNSLSLALVLALTAFAATAQAAPKAKPGTYAIDPVHSFVLFKVQHFGVGHIWGQFNEIDGKITLADDAAKSGVDVSIKTASINTHNTKRDAHLQSPDFFNAAQFPTITFKSTAVKATADGFDVTGDLTIRGKTKSITAKAAAIGAGEDPMKKYRVGFEARATVNRQDFDVSFMPGAIGDQVELILAIEALAP